MLMAEEAGDVFCWVTDQQLTLIKRTWVASVARIPEKTRISLFFSASESCTAFGRLEQKGDFE